MGGSGSRPSPGDCEYRGYSYVGCEFSRSVMDGTIDLPAKKWRADLHWAPLVFDNHGQMTCPLCAEKSQYGLLRKVPLLTRFYCYRDHFFEAAELAA